MSNAWYENFLACPDCQQALEAKEQLESDSQYGCNNCGYCTDSNTPPTIKPNRPSRLNIEHARLAARHASEVLESMDISIPTITYDGPLASRDSSELISAIAGYLKPQSKVLDLGCGPRDQAIVFKHLECQYVGIDYSNPKADMLADAHALPFQSTIFDCVFSYAVLEHLHNPFIAINEIARVIKDGGVYVGTVSQGEPFHDSYFHHTAWGLISLIQSHPELELKRIWTSDDTLGSLSRMGKYPRAIKSLISIVDKIHTAFPFLAPRKMTWSNKDKMLDSIYRSGSICFVVQKRL